MSDEQIKKIEIGKYDELKIGDRTIEIHLLGIIDGKASIEYDICEGEKYTKINTGSLVIDSDVDEIKEGCIIKFTSKNAYVEISEDLKL